MPGDRNVGVILPMAEEYARDLFEGIVSFLERDRSFKPVFLPESSEGKVNLPSAVDSLDGVIAWSNRSHEWIARLLAAGVRVVNCGPDWKGEADVVCVYNEQEIVEKLLLQHFQDLGLKNVAYVTHDVSHLPGLTRRVKWFCRKAAEKGMTSVRVIVKGELRDPATTRLIEPKKEKDLKRQIEILPRPCGLICENDRLGALVSKVVQEAGFSVPRDYAIAGQQNQVIARFSDPPLTSVELTGFQVGFEAARQMSGWLATGRLPKSDCDLGKARLVLRESTGGKQLDPKTERAYRTIQEQACRGITVSELSDQAGITRQTLVTRFTRAFGIDPAREIRRVRLNTAKGLLEDGALSIAEISNRCGFRSQTSFTNFFVRMEGVPPSSLRRSN